MLKLRGLYEIAIRVKDLSRAEPFYRDLLGLQVGLRDETSNWLFLRVGGSSGMVVLQEDPGEWPHQHFAFMIDDAELTRAADFLKASGVETRGPIFHEWMGARSLYFSDPDGHELEFCALTENPS